MKLGCFGKTSQLEAIERAGFDSAELDICELIAMSEREFTDFCRKAEASDLTYEVFSGLLPLNVRIFDRDFDETHWLNHIRTGAARASALGGNMIPFGAGKCRSIPKNCENPEQYEKKLLDFVRNICRILHDYEISLVIEPLGPSNSNYLNRIEEACEFAVRVNCPNCGLMCDLRHMVKNRESMSQILKFKSEIRHAHIDYPNGDDRLFPRRGDGYDYKPYIQTLYESGYQGILAVEATAYQDFYEEAKACVRYLRELV